MITDDRAHDGQPQPHAGLLGGKVRLEKACLILVCNTGTVIGHLDSHSFQNGIMGNLDLDSSGILDGGDGIVDQIDQGLLDLLVIEVENRNSIRDAIPEFKMEEFTTTKWQLQKSKA